MGNIAIGVDVGGSHISSVLVDVDNGKILTNSFVTIAINNKANSDEIIKNWTSALRKSIEYTSIENLIGVGFAMPGPFDYVQGIALFELNDKYESIYGINITEQVKKHLQLQNDIPFRYMNDATSFAIGEAWQGKSVGYKKSVALTLGTGLGSAFIDSGLPVLDRSDVPEMGCVWHIPYKDGIADDYFSTRWFVKNYKFKTGKTLTGVKDLALLAETDETAYNLFVEFGTNLAEFVGPWLKKFDAEMLVIGGDMTKAYKLFGPSLESELQEQNININIDISEILEASALLGSARLLDNSFWKQIQPLLCKM